MKINSRITTAAYLAALVAALDQFSKWWVVNKIQPPPHEAVPVSSWLNIVLLGNKGITFGLFNQLDHRLMPFLLIGVAAVVLFLLSRWLWLTRSMWVAAGLGLVMGGAVGNVIDRARYGAVVDFLDVYYANYHWYAFNVADAAIVAGVGLLLFDSMVKAR